MDRARSGRAVHARGGDEPLSLEIPPRHVIPLGAYQREDIVFAPVLPHQGCRQPEPAPAEAEEAEEENDTGLRPAHLSFANTDLAFAGDLVIAGTYHGFNSYDVEDPTAPTLLASALCPGGQGDVSIYENLLFMSAAEDQDVVNELVGLITAQRAYEVNSRAIRVGDEMLGEVNSLVR